ncbi:hypothetical protein AAVH_00096 [Aphelenchoides avenae]|nr:hypothetical protein AAVH_00096 [Aphelenchus avenae]
MAHVLSRRRTRTASDVVEVEVIDVDTPPQSPTTSSKSRSPLTKAPAKPPTASTEEKDAEIITIDDDDETSLNLKSLRHASTVPGSGRKAFAAKEARSTKVAGHTSDEATVPTTTRALTSNLPKPPCKELNEGAMWHMISGKARDLRKTGTDEGQNSYEALILFRQMIAEVLDEKISSTDEPVDDILGRHAAACNASSLRLPQLLRVSEHMKSLVERCREIKQSAKADSANACVDSDDEITVIEQTQSNVSLPKRPPVRPSSGEPRLRDVGSPASNHTLGKPHVAGGRSGWLSRETRATSWSDQNSGVPRLILGTQTGPSLTARPFRPALKKDATRVACRATPKAIPAPANVAANKPRTPSPDKSRRPDNSTQQREDSVQSGIEGAMLTDGTEPQTELQRRNSETVAADRSERFDSGLEASYADEERMDTSEPNSFEDSAIHGPREDYECEEMVDADSDPCQGRHVHRQLQNGGDQAPLRVPTVRKPPATTYMDEPTKVDSEDLAALTRERESRAPVRKRAVVSPGKSRMPFTGTIRTKQSPPRRHSFITDPDQPCSSAAAYRESLSPTKKPRWSSAGSTIADNSGANGSQPTRDKRASSPDAHLPNSPMITAKAYHLRSRQQPVKAKRATDAPDSDSACGSSGRTAKAAPGVLRGLLKRSGFDGTIMLNGAGSLDQGTEKRRVSWPIDEEQPTRYGCPWAKITTYRKTLYHPDAPDPRTLDLAPPRRAYTEPFEFPTTTSNALLISVPNADGKVAWDPLARMDPMQYPEESERSEQIAQELLNEAAHAFRAVTHAREVRHWVITDSLLKGLRDDVLVGEKTLLTRLEWPALPSHLCKSLERADVNGDLEPGRTRVVLSRVFIVLGFDVGLFHSSEEDDFGADMVTDEVQKLLAWFLANVHKKEVCRVKDIVVDTDMYGNDIWGGLEVTYHTSTPPIVLVTIPEVPDDDVLEKWKAQNEHFRWFVEEFNEKNEPLEGRRLVELLDWAELCHNSPQVARTYEGRVQLLFEEMNLRYGVLLQSNVVDDDAPVNGDDDAPADDDDDMDGDEA